MLNPCIKCGAKPEAAVTLKKWQDRMGRNYQVTCAGCKAHTSVYGTNNAAIRYWNRANPSPNGVTEEGAPGNGGATDRGRGRFRAKLDAIIAGVGDAYEVAPDRLPSPVNVMRLCATGPIAAVEAVALDGGTMARACGVWLVRRVGAAEWLRVELEAVLVARFLEGAV